MLPLAGVSFHGFLPDFFSFGYCFPGMQCVNYSSEKEKTVSRTESGEIV